jgi:hypothetical protein
MATAPIIAPDALCCNRPHNHYGWSRGEVLAFGEMVIADAKQRFVPAGMRPMPRRSRLGLEPP